MGEQFWYHPSVDTSDPIYKGGVRAYETKKCVLCGAKALYRALSYAFCEKHKQEAINVLEKRFKPGYVRYMEKYLERSDPLEFGDAENEDQR